MDVSSLLRARGQSFWIRNMLFLDGLLGGRGRGILKKIENLPTDDGDRPRMKVEITECGEY